MVDIPAMGSNGHKNTAGYHIAGSKPIFKLFKQSTNEIILLDSDNISEWKENGISIINSLYELESIPIKYSLSEPYPNPFNPSTNFQFELQKNKDVILEIYNLQGRVIEKLINENMSAGLHSVIWNAEGHSSGIYFVKLVVDQNIDMKKLMLLK